MNLSTISTLPICQIFCLLLFNLSIIIVLVTLINIMQYTKDTLIGHVVRYKGFLKPVFKTELEERNNWVCRLKKQNIYEVSRFVKPYAELIK